jgi:hypothetical protein
MMKTVNNSFLRRSGVRNALVKAESNFFLLREVTAAIGGWGKGIGPDDRYP